MAIFFSVYFFIYSSARDGFHREMKLKKKKKGQIGRPGQSQDSRSWPALAAAIYGAAVSTAAPKESFAFLLFGAVY